MPNWQDKILISSLLGGEIQRYRTLWIKFQILKFVCAKKKMKMCFFFNLSTTICAFFLQRTLCHISDFLFRFPISITFYHVIQWCIHLTHCQSIKCIHDAPATELYYGISGILSHFFSESAAKYVEAVGID